MSVGTFSEVGVGGGGEGGEEKGHPEYVSRWPVAYSLGGFLPSTGQSRPMTLVRSLPRVHNVVTSRVDYLSALQTVVTLVAFWLRWVAWLPRGIPTVPAPRQICFGCLTWPACQCQCSPASSLTEPEPSSIPSTKYTAQHPIPSHRRPIPPIHHLPNPSPSHPSKYHNLSNIPPPIFSPTCSSRLLLPRQQPCLVNHQSHRVTVLLIP